MSTSTNGNGNLVDEYEEAFQACIHTLTKEDPAMGVNKDEIALEVEQTTSKFIDVARQMETFFVQKRFLLSALRPELVLREENTDLRIEISRKEELIKKHYEQIDKWKAMLKGQQQLMAGPPLQDMRNVPANAGAAGGSGGPAMPQHMQPQLQERHMIGGVPNAMQAQLQQQQQQQQQQLQAQQQQMMAAQQMQHLQQMVNPQQMFMQQPGGPSPGMPRGGGGGGPPNAVGGGGGGAGGGGPVAGPSSSAVAGFSQGGQNVLQGPLAYLEKTTSNIDLVGLGDGRR